MNQLEQPAHKHQAFEDLGPALRKAMNYAGITAAAAALMLAAEGCSPQTSSYWSGTYTKLPDPPADSRVQIGVSTEEDGTVFVNYIKWDKDANRFSREDVHYTTTTLHPGSFSQAGGYSQKIPDGEVLTGGIIVDQAHSKLILPSGNTIDGPTGNVITPAGALVKALER